MIEVRDEGAGPPARAAGGRGLGIAAAAADDLGGRLTLEGRDGATVAALELPATDP